MHARKQSENSGKVLNNEISFFHPGKMNHSLMKKDGRMLKVIRFLSFPFHRITALTAFCHCELSELFLFEEMGMDWVEFKLDLLNFCCHLRRLIHKFSWFCGSVNKQPKAFYGIELEFLESKTERLTTPLLLLEDRVLKGLISAVPSSI